METRTKRIALGAFVALISGLAAALLFVLASRGSVLTLILACFASLPVMIASVSYGLTIGAGAAVIGAAFIAIVFHSPPAILFLAVVGAPAALIASATLLAQPGADAASRDRAPTAAVLSAVILSAAAVAGGIGLLVWMLGGYAPALARAIEEVKPVISQALDQAQAQGAIDPAILARFLILSTPAGLAMSQVLMMIGNLWLAGRVAIISGDLPRPWPRIADDLSLPPVFGALFALACGLVFLGGLPGMLASVAASALGTGFALQGLAVAHVLTRGAAMRFALLLSLYALNVVLQPWPLCLLAIVGLADAALRLRARKSANSTPKPSEP